jgi:hypothetical protein
MERLEKYGVMLALIAQVAAIIWWSSNINYRVGYHDERFKEVELELKALDKKTQLLESEIKLINSKIELYAGIKG